MQIINSALSLRAAIVELEDKQDYEGKLLREQFHIAYNSLKPLNLIKSTFKEAAASDDLKDNIINTSVGLTSGYISKKIFVGFSNSPLKKLLGTVLMFGITNLVSKNTEIIKMLGKKIFRKNGTKPLIKLNGADNNNTKNSPPKASIDDTLKPMQ